MVDVKEGYKQTDVGMIPEDWDIHKFNDLGEAIIGLTYSPSDVVSDGTLVHRSSNIQDNKLSYLDNVFVSKEIHDKLLLKENDILICVRNGSRNLIGKAALIVGESIGETFGAFMSVFRSSTHSPLIFQYVISDIIQKQIEKSLGATINQITNKTLNSFLVPLPPTLQEQKAIATALSDVDELITSLDNLIEKKKMIKQGAMQELLTGKTRLDGFGDGIEYKQTEVGMIPEDWNLFNLGQTSTLKARIGWQGLTTAEYQDTGEYILITGTDFEGGFINWDSCVFVTKERFAQDKNIQISIEDVLVTKDGTIGKVAFIDSIPLPTTLNSGVFVIRPKNHEYDSRFFYHILMSIYFREFLSKLSAGSTINHLYQKDFIHFSFPLPPTLDEQKAIAEVLSELDTEIEVLQTKKEKYKQIKQGMMQELLTGKTRLI